MTGYVAFWGSAESGDGERVRSAISMWLGTEGRAKSRLTGTELTWDADGVEVHAYPGSESPGTPSIYLFEGRLPGPVADARARLMALRTTLNDQGTPTTLDYQARDDNEIDIGALQTLT